MSSGEVDEQTATGSMPSRLVAALAGANLEQLRRWRRSGVVSATALPPRRGAPCAYRWSEYRRARLAALLLVHGLQSRHLRRVLDEYCEVIPSDLELPTIVAGQRAIVKPGYGPSHTAERDQQGAAFDFVLEAALDEGVIAERLGKELPDGFSSIKLLKEFSSGWPLCHLHEYDDIVDVRPDVMGGSPTLKGTRLETAALAALVQAGETVAAIAETYELARSTVERVLAFERALDVHATSSR